MISNSSSTKQLPVKLQRTVPLRPEYSKLHRFRVLALAKLYRAANRDADAYAVLTPAVEGFPPTEQFPETPRR